MIALNKKLFREVWKHRGQMFSIAVVVAVGIMTVLTMRGSYESLLLSRDLYYRNARFPDVWAQLKRAPESLHRRIEEIPGVAAADTRVTFTATLDAPAADAPALGRFVSIPEERQPILGDLHLKMGRYVSPGRRNEVLVSENFAEANNFISGDTLAAVINGSLRDLKIVGTAISPEHAYPVPPGALYPDNERYGIVWMSREALGPAYDMEGAFNEVVLTLAPRADLDRHRPVGPAAGALWRTRRLRAGGPALAPDSPERTGFKQNDGNGGSGGLPRRRRLPLEHRARPDDRHAANGDRCAESLRLQQP